MVCAVRAQVERKRNSKIIKKKSINYLFLFFTRSLSSAPASVSVRGRNTEINRRPPLRRSLLFVEHNKRENLTLNSYTWPECLARSRSTKKRKLPLSLSISYIRVRRTHRKETKVKLVISHVSTIQLGASGQKVGLFSDIYTLCIMQWALWCMWRGKKRRKRRQRANVITCKKLTES